MYISQYDARVLASAHVVLVVIFEERMLSATAALKDIAEIFIRYGTLAGVAAKSNYMALLRS